MPPPFREGREVPSLQGRDLGLGGNGFNNGSIEVDPIY